MQHFKKSTYPPTPSPPPTPMLHYILHLLNNLKGKKTDKTVSEAKNEAIFQFENKHPLFMYFFT